MTQQDIKEHESIFTKKPPRKKKVKAERYLFDHHHFDHPELDQEVEEDDLPPPPPPTFSEEDLSEAKKRARSEGFEQGQKQAMSESLQSIEQATQKVFEALSKQIITLMNNEIKRDQLFEQETLMLVKAVIEKLFPALVKKENIDEIESFIRDILAKQEKNAELIIYVGPEMEEPVIQRVKKDPQLTDFQIIIKEDQELQKTDCSIEWKNGGAIRDISTLKTVIDEAIKEFIPASDVTPKESDENAPIEPSIEPLNEKEVKNTGQEVMNAQEDLAENEITPHNEEIKNKATDTVSDGDNIAQDDNNEP